MASKEKQTIVVDRVHSKRESLGEQPSARQKCVGSYPLSLKMPWKIAVVLIGKYLTTN